jgi:N-methylhydantoinase A
MARELELAWVLTPAAASVLSAYGAAIADIRIDRTRAIDQVLPLKSDRAETILNDLKQRADADLAAQGIAPERRLLLCEVDLRFLRQRASLTLKLNEHGLDAANLLERFRNAYAHQYGGSSLTAGTPVELSTVRVIGIGKTTRAVLPREHQPVAPRTHPKPMGARDVYVARDHAQPIPVYDANDLHMGHFINGPALIDTGDTTLWAPPGFNVQVTKGGSLLARFGDQSDG